MSGVKNLRVSVVGVVEHPLLLFKRPKILGNEQEPGKVARARANLAATGLGDLVDIREGDALETLKDVGGEVDLLLIDGAFSLYLPALKLVEPRLKPGAVVLRENAFEPEYLDYVS
jgi:predicted O-methyltransferase YrrM